LINQQSIQQILSRTRLRRVIEDLDLYRDERKTHVIEEIIENYGVTRDQIQAVLDFAAKSADNAARIAGCLHVFDFHAELRMVISKKCRKDALPPGLLARIEECFGTVDLEESGAGEAGPA
jgi:uncharacterized protein (DUF433 family)